MALDATAREANVRDSVKKFFLDNVYAASNISVTFDKGLAIPKVQGIDAIKWVSVLFGKFDSDTVCEQNLQIMCCTKQDNEGFKLAQLRDTVMGYLTDSNQPDGIRRIPLYRSHATEAWTQIGSMMLFAYEDSGQLTASDETKFKVIPITLKWGAIV